MRGQAGARRQATREREPQAALLPPAGGGEVLEDKGGGSERRWLWLALRDAESVSLSSASSAGARAASGGGEAPGRSRLRLTLVPSEASLTTAPDLPPSRTSDRALPSTSVGTLPGSPLGTAALSVHPSVHGRREDGKGGVISAPSSHVEALQMHDETGGHGRGDERRGGGSQAGRNQSPSRIPTWRGDPAKMRIVAGRGLRRKRAAVAREGA